jgi:hypothetical protein
MSELQITYSWQMLEICFEIYCLVAGIIVWFNTQLPALREILCLHLQNGHNSSVLRMQTAYS